MADLAHEFHPVVFPLSHLFTAGVNRTGHAGNLETLEGGVVHIHVQLFLGDIEDFLGIEDNDVGILADGNLTFVFQTEHAGRVGGQDIHHALETDAALDHPFGMQQHQQGFDAGRAVGNFLVVVFAEHVLFAFEIKRTVVGGHHLKIAAPQSLPESGVAFFGSQGRGHDVFGTVEIRLLVAFLVKQQVLRTGFGIHIDTVSPGFFDLPESFLGRQMHDINAGFGQLHHFSGPADGFFFSDVRPADGMVIRLQFSLCGKHLIHMLDDVHIFRMNLHQAAVFFGFFQQLDHGGIIHPEVINHKYFKTRRTVFQACFFDLFDDFRSGIHDCRVQGIVHADFAFRQGFFALQRFKQGFPLLLKIEIDNTGDTAAGRRLGAAFVVILSIGSHKRHGNMGVGINRSGKDVFPLGIDDFIGRIFQIGADGLDDVALGKDIRQVAAGRVYNGSAFK